LCVAPRSSNQHSTELLVVGRGIPAPRVQIWPISAADDTCAVCACPFCLRDTEGVWGDAVGGAVEWSSGNEPATSPLTGEPVLVWRGAQAGNGNAVTLEVAVNDQGQGGGNPPVSLVVDSPQWLTIGTWFDAYNEVTRDDVDQLR